MAGSPLEAAPRSRARSGGSRPTEVAPDAQRGVPAAWIVRAREPEEHTSGADPLRIWGLSPEERLRRAFARAGCEVRMARTPADVARTRDAIVCRDDVILDERITEALAKTPHVLLATPELGAIAAHAPAAALDEALAALGGRAETPTALRRVHPEEIAPAYVAKLRKWEPPYAFAARADRAREVEARTFAASYKGVTDLVTRWVWPRPAAAATRWCARRGITPNAVTLASWGLALAAIAAFAAGWFVSGLVVAWAMTFLDTVDGKLARVTLTSSRLGDVLDHGLDLLHPPFWYLAWGAGVGAGAEAATAIAVGGYVAGRLLEGVFLGLFGIETHSWRPIDALFRTITARRNPNLILLTVGALGGRPDLGLVMVALWTLVSLGFHAMRLLQALRARQRGEPIRPFDALVREQP